MHGLVWADTDADGLRAPGEAGRPGVTVQLLQGDRVIATTTSDATGHYTFPGVAPGTYSVQFVAPSGLLLSPQDQGSDSTVDSDADVATGRSAPFTVGAGQDVTGPDAGLLPGAPSPPPSPQGRDRVWGMLALGRRAATDRVAGSGVTLARLGAVLRPRPDPGLHVFFFGFWAPHRTHSAITFHLLGVGI